MGWHLERVVPRTWQGNDNILVRNKAAETSEALLPIGRSLGISYNDLVCLILQVITCQPKHIRYYL